MIEPTVNLAQLESHLWESANILRGPVDAADFKTYIFPLLFFKRICDVWDEEYKEITVFEGEDYRLADWLSLSLEEANEDVDNLDELGHIKRKGLLDLLNVAGSEAAPKGYIK